METLRPGLELHDSYEAAAAAVEAMEAAEAASQRARGGLAAIAEDEDAGEDSGSDEADSATASDDEGVPNAWQQWEHVAEPQCRVCSSVDRRSILYRQVCTGPYAVRITPLRLAVLGMCWCPVRDLLDG